MTTSPKQMRLSDLKLGAPGITPEYGGSLAQAACVCLEHQGHPPVVLMSTDGDYSDQFRIHWDATTVQMRRCWADEGFATEQGAYGVATLLVDALTPLEVVERARKGTRFDYWLAPKGSSQPLFQDKSRLEVSGIRTGDEALIAARVKRKTAQISRNPNGLPGYVIVVEFGTPRSRVVKR